MKPSENVANRAMPVFGQWPHHDSAEIEAVASVLRSGKVNRWTGHLCNDFEFEFAKYCGAKHALTVSNGTAALELALAAMGVTSGDEVITTPRSFFASASCIAIRGAKPVFADIDPFSQAITAESIAPLINARTRAILVVHLGGWPADMEPIMALARQHGLLVIEDCAQAHGARYKGQIVGSIGDFGCFSFCTDKIMSTGGEGGMLLCRDPAHYDKAWSWRDHGRDRGRATAPPPDEPGFRWLHTGFGSNLRLTEMQAAIGLAQLQKLPNWLSQRTENARALKRKLDKTAGLSMPWPGNGLESAWYKAYILLDDAGVRPSFLRNLKEAGIPPHVGACPAIYREDSFRENASAQACPNADDIGARSAMFPVDPSLQVPDMEIIADAIADAIASC